MLLRVRQLTWKQWAFKVLPVAAASGFEVGTSTLGLQNMPVGAHTMIRSTVPIFVLLFSVGMGLQEFRWGLLAVVLLVSGGVTLLVSGQTSDGHHDNFPIDGLLLTLLSGVLAGLKWTLAQVLLQGRGLYGKGPLTAGEHIDPFTLLHYMSLSSALSLIPFVLALEWGALREMAETFTGERMTKTALLVVAASLLALVLVLTEFSFIKRVSSLSLCIIGVVKELLLVSFSVGVLGEHLGGRTGLGFFVTAVGVSLYKLIPKGPRKARYEAAADNEPLEGEGEGQRGEGGAATRPTSPSPTRKARTGERGHGGATRQGEGRLHCGGEEGGFFREGPGEASSSSSSSSSSSARSSIFSAGRHDKEGPRRTDDARARASGRLRPAAARGRQRLKGKKEGSRNLLLLLLPIIR
ncbi:unnamed protein product [Pylaiella littoralis]